MKKSLILFIGLVALVRAQSTANTSYADQSVAVAGGPVDIGFLVSWWADDFPQNSTPGRLELFDGSGALVADFVASHHRDSGVWVVPGSGTSDGITTYVARFSPNGTPADGYVRGTWHIGALAAGSYTLRSWAYETYNESVSGTMVWTDSFVESVVAVAPPPPPPPPPPVMFVLTTAATSGGTVSAGGIYPAGTVVSVSAMPDATHDFAGWSGHAGGMTDPVAVLMDQDRYVQANFTPKVMMLATSALGGGNVTPGGSYPFGSWVTVSAAPDATHYFAGWSGDASGAAPSVSVFMDRAKTVQAMFAAKAGQMISFGSPGDQAVGATPTLIASSNAGLPVTLSVLSGPATLSGNVLTITGAGAISVQASQAGDGTTLAASPVTVTFNAVSAAAVIKYRLAARTILQDARTGALRYVLGNP